MSRLKTFLKYAIWVILFFIFSEIFINVGLNSSYKKIKPINEIAQVEIEEAQATLVNGKIRGTIKNSEEDYLTGKYVKIDFYSKKDNLVGSKYVQINTTEATKTQNFNFYFELEGVTSYAVSIVDEIQGEEIEIFPKEMTKSEIIVATLLTVLIFW